MGQTRVASGLLLVLVGIWLLFQAVAGDLGRRLLSYGATASGTSSADLGTGAALGPLGAGWAGPLGSFVDNLFGGN